MLLSKFQLLTLLGHNCVLLENLYWLQLKYCRSALELLCLWAGLEKLLVKIIRLASLWCSNHFCFALASTIFELPCSLLLRPNRSSIINYCTSIALWWIARPFHDSRSAFHHSRSALAHECVIKVSCQFLRCLSSRYKFLNNNLPGKIAFDLEMHWPVILAKLLPVATPFLITLDMSCLTLVILFLWNV